MIANRLVMPCPTLLDKGGHEHDYTAMIARTALDRGMQVLTLHPAVFGASFSIGGERLPVLPVPNRAKTVFGRVARVFSQIALWRTLFRLYGKKGTLWFIHSMPQNQLALAAIGWILAAPKKQSLALFVRQELARSRAQSLLRAVFKLAVRRQCLVVSDGDELAESLTREIGCPARLLPIPVELPGTITRQNQQPRFGYFGACRPSKGFHKLPGLIKAAQGIDGQAAFVIQAYRHRDDAADAVIDGIIGDFSADRSVRLLTAPVDSHTFAEELAACDVILLPYDKTSYRQATSGVFVMAVVARAVVIVTEGTWMARQAQLHNLTRVVTLADAPTEAEYIEAVKSAMSLLSGGDRPSEAEQTWCARQTARQVLDDLMSAPAHRP